MKPIEISTDSWHYRLISKYDFPNTEICGYTRQLIMYLIMTAILVVLLTIPVYMMGDAIGWLIACIVNQQLIPIGEPAIVFFVAVIFFLIPYTISRMQLKRLREGKTEPLFISKAYRSWKDKYCVKVQFK